MLSLKYNKNIIKYKPPGTKPVFTGNYNKPNSKKGQYYKKPEHKWTPQSKAKQKGYNAANKASNTDKIEFEKEYEEDLSEAFDLLGFHAEELLDDREDADDGDDEDLYALSNRFSKSLELDSDPKVIRKRQEMRNFETDWRYNFRDFKFFNRVNYKEEGIDNSKDIRFYLVHATWRYVKEEGTILEFGGNIEKTNASICARVCGFLSNFFVETPNAWEDKHVEEFVRSLNYVVSHQYKWSKYDLNTVADIPTFYVKWEYVTGGILEEYNTDGLHKMIKVHCCWPRAVAAARQVLNEPSKYNWYYKDTHFRVFEADLDFTTRFFYDMQFEPCRWFEVPAWKYEIVQWKSGSRADLVIKYLYTDMKQIKDPQYDKKIPRWKTISFDTEWKNKPFRFPVKHEDPIIVITMCIYYKDRPKEFVNVLMVYVKNGELPADSPKTDYFYRYKSEPGLLQGFKEFILHVDPDVIIDYNGSGFDWRYIADAGEFYFGKEYLSFGRDEKKAIKFQKSEWRNKTRYSTEMSQRIIVDMLKIVSTSFIPGKHFNDFALGTVSMELLGKTKVEFDVNLMDIKWNNVETVGEIWVYGSEDANLPANIESKLNTIYTYASMAQMTGIPIQKALDRGAGSKIEGFIRKLTMKGGIATAFMECFVKKMTTDPSLIDACAKDVKGACVIKPKIGYYKCYVFVLDFNSHYPAIMIILNLCITTHLKNLLKSMGILDYEDYFTLPTFDYGDNDIKANEHPSNPSFVKKHKKKGILAEAEEILWAWRDKVKGEMKAVKAVIEKMELDIKEKLENIVNIQDMIKTMDLDVPMDVDLHNREIELMREKIADLQFEVMVLDGLQNAIKIIMNGIFGQTIFAMSKFYKQEIGTTILAFGRYMLNYVKLYINNTYTEEKGYDFTLDTLYGDTDSTMVAITSKVKTIDFPCAVQITKMVETNVNRLFENFKPVKMLAEKIYDRSFLLVAAKNYCGLMIQDFSHPERTSLDTKGMKHKKRGTSPLCQGMGKKLTIKAVEQKDLQGSLEYVRKIIIKLRTRKVTLSKLIYAVTIGKDITVAIYQYMIKKIQRGQGPRPEVEEAIRERYKKQPDSAKSNRTTATPAVVCAYQYICKDPNNWIDRGMTIHYVFIDGIGTTKGDQVCTVQEALDNDIPYNIGSYVDEVMRISRKILSLMVGDKDVKSTPIYNKIILSDNSVSRIPHSQHVSFFESQFGTKAITVTNGNVEELDKKTGDLQCDKAIQRVVQRYNEGTQRASNTKIVHYFKFNFTACAICSNQLHPFEKLICAPCKKVYAVEVPKIESRFKETKVEMDKSWDVCKKCVKSDLINPLDCINFTCENFSTRLDVTKEYYKDYHRLKALNESEEGLRYKRNVDLSF